MVEIGQTMETSVNTRFDTLPIRLKMEILQFLSQQQDIKSASLVCIKWFRMLSSILPPSFELTDNNSEVLQILKQSFHSSIHMLSVSNYTETLPIYTSTRCEIPKAKYVYLEDGNSRENVVKLLRYYAKCCYSLSLCANSLEKVPSFYLKGLSYESLHHLDIKFTLPTNALRDFGKRTHLMALTQFLESTKLPNLNRFIFASLLRRPDQNHLIQKFIGAIHKFFEKHGQQISFLCYLLPPLILANSLRNTCNLQTLTIIFDDDVPDQPGIIGIRETLKHIKKLKYLALIIRFNQSLEATQYYSEFFTLLRENRKFLKTFYLSSSFSTIDWIPVNCDLELKKIDLRFQEFRENTLTGAMNGRRELKSVTELRLTIDTCAYLEWITHISPWLISTFPNLKYLTLGIPTELNLSDFRSIFCRLVYLKEMLIPRGYGRMSREAENWFKKQTEFITSIESDGGLKILISRPFPNNIFDSR